jgi:hypothetical protein
MSRRWRESPWGRLWRGRRDSLNAPRGHWVLPNDAGSFQVGDFLGLDTYAEPASPITAGPICASPTGSEEEAGPSTSRHPPSSPTTRDDAFLSARSHVSVLEPEPEPPLRSSLEGSPASTDDVPAAATTSTTGLLRLAAPDADRLLPGRSRTRSDEVTRLKPALKARALAPAKSDGAINGFTTDTRHSSDRGKGKGKAKKVFVRLPDDPSPPPAPPGEVLQRTGGEIHETSAAAAEELQATTAASAAPLDVPDESVDAKMRGENVFFCYLVGRISEYLILMSRSRLLLTFFGFPLIWPTFRQDGSPCRLLQKRLLRIPF